MKKMAVLSAIFVLVVLCGTSWGHFPEGVTYYAFQFPDELIPVIDGSLDDWDIVPDAYRIVTEDMYEQLAGMGKDGTGVDLYDMTILLMVGWSNGTNMLYTAAQTFDNVHMVLRPTGEPSLMWRQDCLELMIDLDHSGGQYADFSGLTKEESKRATGAQATQYVLAYPNPDGINIHGYTAATWDTEPPYFHTGFSHLGEELGEGTTTYEAAYVPWVDHHWMGPDQSIVGDLEEGQIVGLQFSFSDFDEPEHPNQYHAFWTVSGQDATFKHAERFADFMLAPIEPGLPTPDPDRAVMSNISATPRRCEPGDVVTISVDVTDPQGVSSVRADIESPDETVLASIPLSPGGSYVGSYVTDATTPRNYYVDFTVVDGASNVYTFGNRAFFTTVNTPPVIQEAWPDPGIAYPGQEVKLYARAWDADGVSSVYGFVHDASGNLTGTAEMRDNGVDPDDQAGDGTFTSVWTTDPEEWRDYNVDIIATDTRGATTVSENRIGFTTYPHLRIRVADGSGNPGGRASVPIVIEDDLTGWGVIAGAFRIDYDSGVLSFDGVTTEGGIASGSAVASNAYDGWARVSFARAEELRDSGTLLWVHFQVSPGVGFGRETWVNLRDVQFNEGWPRANVTGGGRVTITNGVLGDVSGNGEVSAFDAGLILQYVVGIIQLPSGKWRNFTVGIGDVTGNGEVSSYDAAWVLQRVVGLRDWEYTWVGKVVASSSGERKVVLSSELMGDRVKVRIGFDDLSGVLAGQMTLGYDGSLFRVVEVTPSEQLSECGFLFQSHVQGEEVRLAFAGSVALEGGGELAQVVLEVLGEETPEELGHPLELLEVALNEGAIVVGVEEEEVSVAPKVYALSQNSPNPFNAETELGYGLREGGKVRLEVYNVAGQLVRVLVDGEQEVGWYRVRWDGKDGVGQVVASGIYLYRIKVNGFVEVRKMALIR